MPFHDVYAVKKGDNLTAIGRKWGYENPGPIVAYPDNQKKFKQRSPDLIFPGEQFAIPWHPDLLRKVIATSKYLAGETTRHATKLIHEQSANKRDLEDFLGKIDAINFLANLGVGLASLTVQGAKGTMTSKEVLLWLVESRVSQAASITTMVVPAPQAPKKDFKFYVRHTLGPWNPSFWASVYVAAKEKDVDIYLYGADATRYKTAMQIKRQADADIARLNQKTAAAQRQLAMTFYNSRI